MLAAHLLVMRTGPLSDSTDRPEPWASVYSLLCAKLPKAKVEMWIDRLEFMGIRSTDTGAPLALFRTNEFTCQWIAGNMGRPIKTAIEEAFFNTLGAPIGIEVSIKTDAQPEPETPPAQDYETAPASGSGVVIQTQPALPQGRPGGVTTGVVIQTDNRILGHFTFDTFIRGDSNELACSAAEAAAEQPGSRFNPLFIHSKPGLGKTHLLHAIGNHVLSRNPRARVIYVSAEQFMNEVIESMRTADKMPEFRRKYRERCDVLLLDDIQTLTGKPKSEEEFFHTFNALHASGRQIVITSDRPPDEIEDIHGRLISRFKMGLETEIKSPDIETRIAILRAKASRDDLYLPEEVVMFLANYIKSNVRELEGILVKLQAQASLTGAEISLELARELLKAADPVESTQFTVENIQAAVAKHFQVRVADLKSTSKQRSVARPRQIAMYLIRKYTAMGFKQIGHYFGGKDHSTIVHACSKIEREIESDPDMREDVERVQALL